MHTKLWAVAGALALWCTAGNSYAASAIGFSAASWQAADSVLGVDGFVIEDFEDTSLATGLQVQVIPPTLAGYGPTSTLPFIFDPVPDDTFGTVFDNGVWDGAHGLINRPFKPITSYNNDGGWSDVAFLFGAGATSVGFSVEQADANIVISLDLGGGFSVFANSTTFLTPGGSRNGYLRIDAGPGETIFGVLLDNGAGNADGILYDHLAFQPIPLPAAIWLFSTAIGGVLVRERYRRPGKP